MQIPEISLAAEEIFKISGFSVTNTLFLTLFLSFLLAVISFFAFSNIKLIPGKLQNLWEFLLETLYNFFNSITGDEEKTREIYPLAATLFLLVLSSNLIELIPGIGVFKILRSPSSDLNFTFILALFSIIGLNFLAIKKVGVFKYSKRFLNFQNPLLFFVGVLESIGELTKILSLTFRLFGNLFAGEILLIVISCLFALIMPLPFLGLEILVGFIQAIIFSSLTVIFYTSATQTEHG